MDILKMTDTISREEELFLIFCIFPAAAFNPITSCTTILSTDAWHNTLGGFMPLICCEVYPLGMSTW